MSEDDKTETPKKDIFDPRVEYEWVPMVLVIVAFLCGAYVYVAPYFVLQFSDNPENAQHILGLMQTIPVNETFNYLLVSLVSFWLGKKSIENTNKP